jgi:hypothetical protein
MLGKDWRLITGCWRHVGRFTDYQQVIGGIREGLRVHNRLLEMQLHTGGNKWVDLWKRWKRIVPKSVWN